MEKTATTMCNCVSELGFKFSTSSDLWFRRNEMKQVTHALYKLSQLSQYCGE